MRSSFSPTARASSALLAASLAFAPATMAAKSPRAPQRVTSATDAFDGALAQAKKKKKRRRKPKGEGEGAEAGAAAAPKSLYAKGIGFSARALTKKEKAELRRTGVVVGDVQNDLPAAKSGLKDGDIITSFDGKSAKSPKAIIDAILDGEEGQTFKLVVVRNGVDTTVDLRLPGESAEEREERERKEEEERKEREEREHEEQKEREREEAEERKRELEEERERAEEEAEEAEEEAERLREQEERAEELDEALEEASEDKFGLLECLVCSFCLPTFTPVWIIVMLLVDNDTPVRKKNNEGDVPRRADSEMTVVSY